MNLVRRDPRFRQLAEAPTFLDDAALDIGSVIRLDRFLPAGVGLAMPLTVQHTSTGTDPYFVSRSDLRGDAVRDLRTPRYSSSSIALSVRTARAGESATFLQSLLDHVGATATFDRLSSRSEYQKGGSSRLTLGVEYLRTVTEPQRLPAVRRSRSTWAII